MEVTGSTLTKLLASFAPTLWEPRSHVVGTWWEPWKAVGTLQERCGTQLWNFVEVEHPSSLSRLIESFSKTLRLVRFLQLRSKAWNSYAPALQKSSVNIQKWKIRSTLDLADLYWGTYKTHDVHTHILCLDWPGQPHHLEKSRYNWKCLYGVWVV